MSFKTKTNKYIQLRSYISSITNNKNKQMNNIRNLILVIFLTGLFSCGDDFLDESPKSFFSTANAFKTENDFNSSINNLYGLVRAELYTVNDNNPFEYLYRTDMASQITVAVPNLDAEINPNSSIIRNHWTPWWKIISEANTVLSRLSNSELTPEKRTLFEAKAKFFRGLGYRSLAYLFGGVPLVLEEVATEKIDFVRSTRKEVYTQVISDLDFASKNLPKIATVKDGEISDLVALHLLSEVYLADGQFQNAVNAATTVIDDPATALMTSRFGTRKGETPGDVYWDLFRKNNQNRKTANNTEGLWVIQIENDVLGGAAATTTGFASGDLWSAERVHAPLVRDVRIGGKALFNWPASDYSSGGRGVGFLAPSTWFINNVWESDFETDIRNANHNFVRKFKVTTTDTANPLFGQEISFDNIPAGLTGLNGVPLVSGKADRAFYPYQTKCTEPGGHPLNLLVNPAPYPLALKGGAGGTYQDQYMMRLAETYLLRAEGYLGLNDNANAAADINAVRERSNASPVAPGQVNIDYILDERIRELGIEEKRMFTLMRMGKWVERVKKCNPFYAAGMQDRFNLWPIPQSEIERNRGAVLEQNPGY